MQTRDERMIEFFREAIRIPSFSGQEKGMAELIKSKMEAYGFDEVVVDSYGSVIGTINGKRPGITVLMDGHMDVVDVADSESWTHDPFGAELADGRIYGRGSCDMKGGDITMLSAAAHFAEDTGKDFAGKLCVSCSVHEECFEGVSPRAITPRVKPDFVIIGEPTNLALKIGQLGRAEIVVETEGVACHSSSPDKGVNAVYHMVEVVRELEQIVPRTHPQLGKGILELVDIVSSPFPGASIVPSLCRATYDRRTLPDEDEAFVLGQINDAIERVKARIPNLKARCYLSEGEAPCWTGETIRAKRFFPAWLLSEDNEYVQKVVSGLREAGIDAPIETFPCCTNASHFCGEAGIPTVGIGPTSTALAHVRDEYAEVEQLCKACRGYESILRKLLLP